jgi:hypothetical protein
MHVTDTETSVNISATTNNQAANGATQNLIQINVAPGSMDFPVIVTVPVTWGRCLMFFLSYLRPLGWAAFFLRVLR